MALGSEPMLSPDAAGMLGESGLCQIARPRLAQSLRPVITVRPETGENNNFYPATSPAITFWTLITFSVHICFGGKILLLLLLLLLLLIHILVLIRLIHTPEKDPGSYDGKTQIKIYHVNVHLYFNDCFVYYHTFNGGLDVSTVNVLQRKQIYGMLFFGIINITHMF
jgi:hypothetical protein